MRVIHTGIQSEPAIGVFRQLEAEKRSSEGLGLSWYSLLYTGKPNPSPVNKQSSVSSDNRLVFRLAYYRWLFKESRNYDVVLLRYSSFDPFQLLFVLFCGRQVYSVHHTLEVPELKLSTAKFANLKTGIERVLGPVTLSLMSGIVAVSEEILNYEMQRRLVKRSIPHKVYTNGVDYHDRVDLMSNSDRQRHKGQNPVPEFLFISSVFREWQGLEDLLEQARKYNGDFICHIVGELTEQQSEMLSADTRFVAHGLLDKAAISKLITQSDIGISNLAAYKKNMDYVPALKVREYLMEGLAVYAGHGDILPDSFEYYKNGPIDLATIVDFANKNRDNERSVVSEISRPFIEKEILLKELHTFLLENRNG